MTICVESFLIDCNIDGVSEQGIIQTCQQMVMYAKAPIVHGNTDQNVTH